LKLLLCGRQISADRELTNSLKSHHTIISVTDIKQIEKVLRQNDIALILLELSADRKAELKTIKKIKSRYGELIVLVINNQKSIHNVVEVFDAGAADVFSRPYNIKILVDRISALVKSTFGFT